MSGDDHDRAERILADLDEAQSHAVATPSRLVAVLAGAGSGKTRVLTRRIALRIHDGSADARHTLALTFTREAAGELRRRLRRLGLREPVEAGTFHAIALSLLRQRWHDRGQAVPAIVNDRARLLREVAGGVPLAALGPEVDWAAAQGVAPDRYVSAARSAGRRGAAPPAQIATALAGYQQLKRRRGVIDLDDLLTLTVDGLAADPLWAEVVRYRFRHLHVDEAQDLNPTQFRLLRLLAGDTPDLYLVGDPAQAIFGFNGADPTLLADIGRRLDGVEIVRLPANYRCVPQIVDAGRHVLQASGHDTDLVAARDVDGRVRVAAGEDELAEAALVASWVRDLDPMFVRQGQVAVLARTHAQLPALAAGLAAAGIAVQRSAIPPGSPLAQVIRAATALPSASRLRAWAHDVVDTPPTDVAGRSPTGHEAAERQVGNAVLEFLREQPVGDGAALRSWIATTNPFRTGDDVNGVDLLTFHAAKGREWRCVAVTGVETGLVPHRSAATVAARAEEARLLHVAVTRASDDLLVTWAHRRGGYRRKISPLLAAFEAIPADPPMPLPPELHRPPSPILERRRRLADWRAHAARAAGVLPEAICPDGLLDAIEAADPGSPAELADATGFGAITAARLFPAIRTALTDAS